MGRAATTLHLAPALLLGLITLLVLSWAAQIRAEPITTFDEPVHFRSNIGPNSVGLPPGDQQNVGILNVSPTAGTAVTAAQGAVTRPLPFTPYTVFPTLFRSLEPFDPSLTGPWSITATNGPNGAGPLLTPPIANPQLLPFAENLQVVGTGPTPTVTWSLPDLTDVESLRFRAYNDANNDTILNIVLPSRDTTAFTIPGGLLVPGVPYVFSVILEDREPRAPGLNNLENSSTAFTQSAYFVTGPLQLLVSSELTNSVKRYDAATGAYLGEFVSAGVDGQVEPRGLTFGPDGNLYVGGGGDGNPNVKRFDGKTGAPLGTVTSGYPPRINDILFGPDGYLYVAVFESDSVFRVDVTTKTKLGEIGPVDGPGGVAFGADGNLYVGSFHTGEVLRFDGTTGAFLDVFATVPPGGSTSDVTFGPDGDLYVAVIYCGPAGCLSGDVARFDGTTGASKGSFIPSGDPRPVEPYTLLFGADGKLYVTSHATDQVLRYDGTTGAFVDSLGGGGLDGPAGIALVTVPKVFDLLVSSEFTNSVKRYDGVTGIYLGEFVSAGVDGPVEPLGGLTFGPDGNLYVGGGRNVNAYVKRFDGITGAFIDTVTSVYPPPQFGIAFGPDGYLYGAVAVDDYVFVVDPTTGAEVGRIGAGSPLDGPSHVTFGADGNLYVSSGNNGVVLRFDGETGDFIDIFATLPPGGGTSTPRFGPDGDLYVLVWYCGPGGGCPTGDIWRFDGTTGASKGSFIQPGDPHPVEPFVHVFGPGGILFVTSRATDEVLRYDATGHFIDSFVTGGGLNGPTGIALPEPGAATQLGAGLLGLVALARRRYRGSRSRRTVL